MFIEKFFNPPMQRKGSVYLSTKEALDQCKVRLIYIRHWSFRGNQYIKYDGTNFVWSDGSRVDKRRLPKKGQGWGIYHNNILNRNSF